MSSMPPVLANDNGTTMLDLWTFQLFEKFETFYWKLFTKDLDQQEAAKS